VTTQTYDANGNLLTSTGPVGNTTTYHYDDPNHPGDVTSITDPDGHVTTFTYDSFGNKASSTISPLAGVADTTRSVYDADNELVCQVSAIETTAGVNCPAAGGNRVAKTTTTTFDPDGEVLTVTDPNGHTTTYGYDSNGNRTAITDPAGHTTTYTYDLLNRLTGTTSPDGATSTTAYDAAGNVASTTDGNGHTTTNAYNALNQLALTTNPLGQTTSYTYDQAGNRATVTDAQGRVTTYTYDAANRLTGIAYSDGTTHDVTYAYDGDGRRAAMTDGTGTTTYSYDAAGRLTSSTNGAGATVSRTYDPAGNVVTLTYPNGKTVTNTFDGTGDLASITDWLGAKTTFGYDPNQNLTRETFGTSPSVIDTFSYDPANNLTSITDTSGRSTLYAISYARTSANLIASATAPGRQTAYGYDAANQVTAGQDGTFSYDPAGNLTQLGSTTLTYNAGNELTSTAATAGTTTFTYDSEGNRASAAAPSQTAIYTYDQGGRLTAYSTPVTTATYTYNGDGLRASKTVNGVVTSFVWDTAPSLPQLLAAQSTSYIYGPGGLPIESIDSSGAQSFYDHDALGSTIMLTDIHGAKRATFTYTSYGQLASGPTGKDALLYAGQYFDAESGLYYLRARYYEPTTGQFISVDPLVTSTHAPYSYASNDPLNNVDPRGTSVWSWVVAHQGSILQVASWALCAAPGVGWVACGVAFGISTLDGLVQYAWDAYHGNWGSAALDNIPFADFAPDIAKFIKNHAHVSSMPGASGGLCGSILPASQPNLQGSSTSVQGSNFQLQ